MRRRRSSSAACGTWTVKGRIEASPVAEPGIEPASAAHATPERPMMTSAPAATALAMNEDLAFIARPAVRQLSWSLDKPDGPALDATGAGAVQTKARRHS